MSSSSDGAASAESDSNSESGSESGESGGEDPQHLQALEKRARTEKARAAALLAHQKRKDAKERGTAHKEHPASRYKPDLQPRPEINKPGNFYGTLHRRRLRVVFSWFKAWCSSLNSWLLGPGSRGNHCFTVNIVDDSNFVLSQTFEGASTWRKSRVIPVMNQAQSLVISYGQSGVAAAGGSSNDSSSCNCHRTFLVHTPLVCLTKTNAASLGLELQSWLVTFLGRVGRRFQRFGLEEAAFAHFPIQGTLLVWDSLVTNIALQKELRYAVHMHHQKYGHEVIHPLFASVCNLHQCSLARKPMIHHFGGFWSSVVRLSHLFEISSFRLQFRSVLIELICANFRVVHCANLPDDARQWRYKRNRFSSIVNDDPSYPRKRRALHMHLTHFDNGNPEGLDFVHYCTGSTCCAGTHAKDREHFALLQFCKLYSLLFGQGFPVPLLYRWVHGHKALQWVKEPRPRANSVVHDIGFPDNHIGVGLVIGLDWNWRLFKSTSNS